MEPEPEPTPEFPVGFRCGRGIVLASLAPWGPLPPPPSAELPADQPAASLLWALDSKQKGDLSLLYWILRESLRRGHLGARELLRLENACKCLFPRKGTEQLARTFVESSGELTKASPRLSAPELKVPAGAVVPALRAETPVQPGRTAAACEEWKRVRRHEWRVLVRLTRDGPLWDGIAAGSERWMEKLAQLQAYDRPVFTHVPGSFSTSAGGDTVTVNQYDSSCTALAGHTTARMRRGVHCAQFRIKSAGSEVDPNMPRVGIVQADTRTEGGYCASDHTSEAARLATARLACARDTLTCQRPQEPVAAAAPAPLPAEPIAILAQIA